MFSNLTKTTITPKKFSTAKIIQPLLLGCGTLLVVNSLLLMRRVNLDFGSKVPLIIGTILVIHGLFWQQIIRFLAKHDILRRIWKAFWVLFMLWVISFAGFVIHLKYHMLQAKHIPVVNGILVLGAVTENGKASPTLAKRLEEAAPIAINNPHAVIVVSGGLDGAGVPKSEGQVMAEYLNTYHAIPLSRIIIEEKSRSTAQNFQFSQPLFESHGVNMDQPIAVVTSDFHTLRSQAIGKKRGYKDMIMVGSETPISIRYNAWFREYFAFIHGWLMGEY